MPQVLEQVLRQLSLVSHYIETDSNNYKTFILSKTNATFLKIHRNNLVVCTDKKSVGV